jgi:ABC-2 type transport system permease protein
VTPPPVLADHQPHRPVAGDAKGTPAPAPGVAVWFLRVLVAFARREARTVSGYRIAFLLRGMAFGLSVVTLAFLSRLVGATTNPHLAEYGGDYLAFAVVGLVVMDLQHVGVSNLAQRIRTAQILGLLEAEMATPAPAWIVLGVGPVYEFCLAAGRSAVYFLLAIGVFGVGFPRANLTSLVVAAPLVVAAFVGLGLLSAATTMLVRRTNPIAMLLASASMLLSGVAYPVSVLPPALRAIGRMLPLTHALELVRGALLRGSGLAEMAGSIAVLAIFAGLLVPAGVGLFFLALRRARVDGSLTHF